MDEREKRIAALSARLGDLERHVADEAAAIRAELRALAPAAARPGPAPTPPPPARRAPRPAPDLAWLTGPRGLAVAGGTVTLLGIVFVFVLAASRGWIGPAVRCGIGGGVSVLLVAAAVVARRRFGQLVAALAAAGTGIGGSYVTLYAASRGYHLLGAAAVWPAVVVVAAAAVAFAVAWSSQLLATLGLVAVVVAPVAVQGKLTALGLGASTVAAAAALALGGQRRWRVLGGLSYGLLLLQATVYVDDAKREIVRLGGGAFAHEWSHRGSAGAIACVVFALAIVAAAAYRRRSTALDLFTGVLAGVSLPFALFSAWTLVEGDDARGSALLALAAVYALPGAALWASRRTRDLAELLGAFALFAVAFATATYLSGGGLLVAWALEGLALVAFAARLRRRRYQAAGLAYLAAAALHLFAFETPLAHLFTERSHPAEHAGELLLLLAAVAASALLLRGRELLLPQLELVLTAAAALLALYAASLGVLEAAQHLGAAGVHAKFQRGETLVSALWAVVALGLLAVGLTRRVRELRAGGLALLGLALAKLFLFDLSQLSSLARAVSFLAVGLALLVGGFLVQRLARNVLPPGGAPQH